MTQPTFDQGLALLQQLEGCEHPSLFSAMAPLAPDLATMAVSFVYGQLCTRPQLTLPQRQLVTVAALAGLGNARPQLQFHIGGALNVGCSPQEIVELMLHLAVYAGFPAALNGLFAAQEVFRARGESAEPAAPPVPPQADRYRAGWQALQTIDGHAGEQVIASLAAIAPDLGRFIIEFAFGDVYTRPGLTLLQRELATVAALAAMGTAAPQLRVHLHGLLNVGGTPAQMTEALMHIAAYAGFPAAINGVLLAQQVLAERPTLD